MKISHSDKALLITVTGACFLVLVFFFLGVKPYQGEIVEEFIEIPLAAESPELEKEEKTQEVALTKKTSRSNQAYNANTLRNESRQLFKEEDDVRKAIEEQQRGSISELNAENDTYLSEKQKERAIELASKREQLKAQIEAREAARNTKKGNSSSTVTYNLPGREAIRIPNPVYTCDAIGIIVINITVNDKGTIVKKEYNKKASSSSNGCLIDQALDYLNRAYFDNGSLAEQEGTVIYSFQG
ncbi:hypothetical protein EAX61_03425 [Dokdonia sinensis]|uniref:Energy transducer TonB n=1 Tax=Dokdonia sinensis TaxID=2479847 RepID=A0A3M0GP49_9FLAO|nr:hypothetical protein [Dokdonia sinensis]RMB63453.1 hypothetical protein EAX61_03425 [Dokdonia sinensis]